MKNKKNFTLLIIIAFVLLNVVSTNAQESSSEKVNSKIKFLLIEYSEKGEVVFKSKKSRLLSGYSFKTSKNEEEKLNKVCYKFKKKRLSFILKEIGYKDYINKLIKDPIMDMKYYQKATSREKANKTILNYFLKKSYLKKD